MRRLSGHITIAAVGKLRTPHWQAAQEAYQKRLRRYTKVKLVEVKDVAGRHVPDGVAMAKEGEQLLAAVTDAHRLIALTPRGKQMSSPGLARFLKKRVELYGRLAFLIGGPLGFSEETVAACHEQLSLSALTFPHELARIVLLEQLYRACTILNNEKYHK